MTLHRSALLLSIFIASVTCAVAQTPPTQEPTDPSAASSPHQRKSTTTKAGEAPPTSATEPSSASSPHQRQATKEGKAEEKARHEQMMKDCMKTQQSKDSSMSKDEAKKACMEQMEMRSDEAHSDETKPY